MTRPKTEFPDPIFRYAVLAAQTLFGAWFLVHGLNYWWHFFPQPPAGTGPSDELIGVLIKTGIFGVVKLIEVAVGVLLLLQRFVPLAVVVGFPVTIVIAYLNLVMNHDAFHLIVGVSIILINGLIVLGHIGSYRALLAYHGGEPNLRELQKWLRNPFAGGAPVSDRP